MNLHALLSERERAGRPIGVGVIGAGKFGTMFLSQIRRTPGMRLLAVADLHVDGARAALARVGWPASEARALHLDEASSHGTCHVTDDAETLLTHDAVDVVVESTGDPRAGIAHAQSAIRSGKHIVMVNVEADALAGPLLARQADAAGLVYSMAYGDQPALIHELVEWARAVGFDVVCAGKGTKYLPDYHASTPDTVWTHYGLTEERALAAGMNAKMFNSFVDGTKSAVEMAAVANACGLRAPDDGLAFPPAGAAQLAERLKPLHAGGVLRDGQSVEVVSSLERSGEQIADHLRSGVYVTLEAPSDYVADCFAEYGMVTDASGRFAAVYRPYHLVGLELGISVAMAGARGEATGVCRSFNADVAAVAKADLAAGQTLDGEGGYTVYGRLMPATRSLELGALPIGLAGGVRMVRDVASGHVVRWADVELDESGLAVRVRKELEAALPAEQRPPGDHRPTPVASGRGTPDLPRRA